MSLINRHRAAPGETAEQTLARLAAASNARGRDDLDEARQPRFKVVRLAETYDMAEVDAFIDTIDQRTADEVRKVHFSTVRLRGYDKSKVDRFLDEYEDELNLAAGVTAPAHPTPAKPAPPTPARRFDTQRDRLARIPQSRWRRICVAFWVGLALWVVIVSVILGALWPTGSGDDFRTILTTITIIVSFGAPFVLWGVGVARTGQMDPAEWTEMQRESKEVYDKWGEMGFGGG